MRDVGTVIKSPYANFLGPGGTIWGVTPDPSHGAANTALMQAPGDSGPHCLPPIPGRTWCLQVVHGDKRMTQRLGPCQEKRHLGI